MTNYIVTFGQIHAHRVNGYTFDKDSVAIIQAEDYGRAREIAFKLFGGKFHQCLTEKEFDSKKSINYFPRGKHHATSQWEKTMPSDMTEEGDK